MRLGVRPGHTADAYRFPKEYCGKSSYDIMSDISMLAKSLVWNKVSEIDLLIASRNVGEGIRGRAWVICKKVKSRKVVFILLLEKSG